MNVLGIIPARGGSRGVPRKCVRDLLGKPVIAYTITAAMEAKRIDRVVVTTDDRKAKEIAETYNIITVDRPAELAADTARIDDAMRHCCKELEQKNNYKPDVIVLLYGNVPVRAEGIIDKTIERLIKTNADSVQTFAPVGKFHPYWLYQLDNDRATKYIDNQVFQRQDLPQLYTIDGAVGAVKYEALMAAQGSDDPHAFWGTDRRGLIQESYETVDIDNLRDLYLAEAVLREQQLA